MFQSTSPLWCYSRSGVGCIVTTYPEVDGECNGDHQWRGGPVWGICWRFPVVSNTIQRRRHTEEGCRDGRKLCKLSEHFYPVIMVKNICKRSRYIIISTKVLTKSYHVLKFDNVFPSSNRDMAKKCDFTKIMTLKGKCHMSKQMVPSDSLSLKHRSRHQNRHPKFFTSKDMVKDIFSQNGGQHKVNICVRQSGFYCCLTGKQKNWSFKKRLKYDQKPLRLIKLFEKQHPCVGSPFL